VPRALCLPGIAEAIGVVRSALHLPLKELENSRLVTIRTANVIGTGSRKRKVVHISEEGRRILADQSRTIIKRGQSHGPLPEEVSLHGRKSQIEQLLEKIISGNSILLNGLPGIGKTSLARTVSSELLNLEWTVRWATCTVDTDVGAISSMWCNNPSSQSSDAIAESLDSSQTLLVLDEIQQLSERHIGSVRKLIVECSRKESSVLAIVRAPSPLGEIHGFEDYRLDGILADEAISLLPEEIEKSEAIEVAKALGGHPLALHLWSPEDVLPERVEAVQSFVESTVFNRLSSEGEKSLDELCISPLPLKISEMSSHTGLSELDDSAILRWSFENVEPHHLIGNVRRASFGDNELSEKHLEMASIWASRKGNRARRIETFHRLSSGEDIDEKWLLKKISEIASLDNSAAAVLIEEAIKHYEKDSLREMAVGIALERGEENIASRHLVEIPESPKKNLLSARLARIEGDYSSAEKLEELAIAGLDKKDKIRAQINSLVRLFDDRLPGQIEQDLSRRIRKGIDSVDFSDLSTDDREVASLSLDLLLHAFSLEIGDLSSAAVARDSIENRLGLDDPRLTSLDLRARLSAKVDGRISSSSLDSARHHIETSDDVLDKIRTMHMALEASFPDPPDWLSKAHSEAPIRKLRSDLFAHRRVIAQWWFWSGQLDTESRLWNWREAIDRFRAAECINASNQLLSRLSKEI